MPATGATSPGESPDPERYLVRYRTALVLGLGIGAFIAIVSMASWLRFEQLTTSTWDLGIYQQALWSTSQGHAFYEAADWETGGFGSFLQVHSAIILYLVVPVYRLAPTAATLFVLQAGVVGLAALPLYALTRSKGASARRGLLVASLYLVSAPVVTSCLYDFHIEAFLPLEVIGLFFLWETERYLYGAALASISFLTMEIAPVFAAAIAAYFLLERGSSRLAPSTDRNRRRSAWYRRLPPVLRNTRVLASLALAAYSVVSYWALLDLRLYWLASAFGFPAFPAGEHGYVIGGSLEPLGLSVTNLSVGFLTKVAYWTLILALVLFLPLRAPRTLILVAPWVAFTFLSADLNYVLLGYQYGFFAVAGLFPGVAIGAAAWSLPPPHRSEAVGSGRSYGRWRLRGRDSRLGLAALFGALVVANLSLTPFDPLMQGSGQGSAYAISYSGGNGFAGVEQLAGLIPPSAGVVASDYLFPLVANDVNAYTLFWHKSGTLDLPFNSSHAPTFVFLSENRLDAVPDWLALELYNVSDYGMRGIAWTTPVGAVTLFEWNFTGVTLEIGAVPPVNVTIPPQLLQSSDIGWLISEPGTPSGLALETTPYASGQLWTTPGFNLPAGTYNITFWVKAWVTTGSGPVAPSVLVLGLEGNPFSQTGWFSRDLPFSQTAGATFHPISFTVTTTEPVVDVVLRGYALTWASGVGVSDIVVAPA